jgi:hypothetical protein
MNVAANDIILSTKCILLLIALFLDLEDVCARSMRSAMERVWKQKETAVLPDHTLTV